MLVTVGKRVVWTGLALLAAACNNPGAGTTSPNPGAAGGGSGANGTSGSGGSSSATQAAKHVQFDSFTPQSLAAPNGGSGGTASQAVLAPPFGVSTICGDAIVGPT